jgi:type IV pilus assembly protein PilV
MHRSGNYRPTGFSLLEVLISLVVLSVALLGTAQLTAASLKSTNTAYYRSQATVLADDIFDRMRANIIAARVPNQHYNIDAGSSGPVLAAPAGSMAFYDCTEWTTNLAAALPEGKGTVNVDPAGVATITIQWHGTDTDPVTHQLVDNTFSTSSQL